MGAISPEGLAEIKWAAHDEVMNRRDPYVYDRHALPWLSLLMRNKMAVTGMGGKVIQKVKVNGGLQGEFWEGRDVLTFRENRIDFDLEFPLRRYHLGLEILHSELEDVGYTVTPNASRGRNYARRVAAADIDRLVDLFEEKVEDQMNQFDEELDKTYLLDGTQDPLAPIGLFGYLTLDPTAGLLGGKNKSNKILQHNVASSAAVNDIERDLNGLVRECNRFNRGYNARVDYIQAGGLWLDQYVAYMKANGLRYQTDTTQISKVDIGIPDSGIHFQNIPVVWNPTFDDLYEEGFNPGFDLRKCATILSTKTWKMGSPPNKAKEFSAPMDPPDQRFTRTSLDHRGVLIPKKMNGNGLHIAP